MMKQNEIWNSTWQERPSVPSESLKVLKGIIREEGSREQELP